MSYENALQQWRAGERRLAAAPPERRRLLDRVVEQICNELRRRLGGTFKVAELVALYDAGTAWTMDVAVRLAPDAPWAWEATTVTDAAFARYLREAADYAGGRAGDRAT
jgi:hypothetical protein